MKHINEGYLPSGDDNSINSSSGENLPADISSET